MFTKLLSSMTTESLQNMPPEAKEKKWSGISWILLSRMREIGFSKESVGEILSQINSKSSSKKVFTNPVRYHHLLQLLFKVVEEQPYEQREVELISKAILKILEPTGRIKREKDSISIKLQMLTNIFNLFGKDTLIDCLDHNKDGETFFQEKLNELIKVDEIENFGQVYQNSFGSFRDPTALFTYIRTIKDLPEVLKALSVYVNAVLKGEFPAVRYDTDLNPHLKTLFENNKGLKESWLKSPEEPTVLESTGKEEKMDYHQFFKNKILIDKHLNPVEFSILCDYLDGNEPMEVDSEDPKSIFQHLAIDLCKGEIEAKEFVTKVNELHLDLGEFQNDLQTLELQQSSGEWVISESDDPCDLLLIGTEIKGSCQRVNGSSGVNKCLVSYIMNGEIRPIVVKRGGKLVARSLLRLMWDEKNKTPVLLQERLYSNVADESVEDAINEWAIQKAEKMNIPLVSTAIGNGKPYQGKVEFLGGLAPFVYSDASGGVKHGPFETEGCHLLYEKLKK